MKSSPQLLNFYREYKKWLDIGAPKDGAFYRGSGLCFNLSSFLGKNDPDMKVQFEMKNQFFDAGLNTETPFDFDFDEYAHYGSKGKSYLNIYRRGWVEDRIRDMENTHE